jgi:predicted regulator of amino acid metabolism with ACT domain
MAAVAELLSRHGTVVRQALADDPEMVPDAKLTLVVEGQLTAEAVAELKALRLVKSLKILK